MRTFAIVLLGALAMTGCYSRSKAASPGSAATTLQQHGYRTHSIPGGVESSWEWQKPNNPPSALCFGLIWTRHKVVNGEVISETYGWSLIPGLFGILPGFLVNIPAPLEDEVNEDLTGRRSSSRR